jgi:hypothetical protein
MKTEEPIELLDTLNNNKKAKVNAPSTVTTNFTEMNTSQV